MHASDVLNQVKTLRLDYLWPWIEAERRIGPPLAEKARGEKIK